MLKNEKGSIAGEIWLFVFLFVIVGFFLTSWKGSNEEVSGIAYNTSNDALLSGNTYFSVRASESTYVSEENKTSYCLPANSPYKGLVNRAARDKRIKIAVSAHKYFAIQAPWTCYPNVVVAEVK